MMPLTDYINAIITLTSNDTDLINAAFKPVNILKGSSWIHQGEICNHVGFLESGQLRSFYIDQEGNEITCFFVMPNNFISSFTSFLTQTPTNENIVAMEDSVMFTIDKKELESLSDAVPKIHILRRILAENSFISMEKRISMLQTQSATNRYQNMVKDNPEIILSVPLQYMASFLGITPQHFSRLRKKIFK